jgi:hypothetical protein
MIERDIFGLKNDVKSEIGVFWSAQYQYSGRRIDTIPQPFEFKKMQKLEFLCA